MESKVFYEGDRNKEFVKWEIFMRKFFVIGEENCYCVIFKIFLLKYEIKFVGLMKLRVYVLLFIDDMDIFVILCDILLDGKEVVNLGCYIVDYFIS